MSFRYLVIDDAGFIREMLKGICNAIGGVYVGEAEGNPEALQLVRETLPDIILLDFVLPGQNGMSLALEFRKVWPEGRIIGCTSLDSIEIHQQALSNGVDIIVTKPFTKESIAEAIHSQMSERKEVAT